MRWNANVGIGLGLGFALGVSVGAGALFVALLKTPGAGSKPISDPSPAQPNKAVSYAARARTVYTHARSVLAALDALLVAVGELAMASPFSAFFVLVVVASNLINSCLAVMHLHMAWEIFAFSQKGMIRLLGCLGLGMAILIGSAKHHIALIRYVVTAIRWLFSSRWLLLKMILLAWLWPIN